MATITRNTDNSMLVSISEDALGYSVYIGLIFLVNGFSYNSSCELTPSLITQSVLGRATQSKTYPALDWRLFRADAFGCLTLPDTSLAAHVIHPP